MQEFISRAMLPLALPLMLLAQGCGAAYSTVTEKSQLGAAQYEPAVYVPPENKAKYDQVLVICRQAASKRQVTAAQEAQLRTITGTTVSAVEGAAQGAVLGQIFDNAGLGGGAGQGALVGGLAGIAAGLASSFASGAEKTAAETKRILLNCLETVSAKGGGLWNVLE